MTERALLNPAMVMLNIAVFLLMVFAPFALLASARSPADVIEALALVPARVLKGEAIYTLLTSAFLHASIAHVAGNMIFLYIFGNEVELSLGRARYLALYLLSAIIASFSHIASTLFAGDPSVPAVGSSGAVSGIMGAYLTLFHFGKLRAGRAISLGPAYVSMPAALYIIVWFAYQLLFAIADLRGELYVAFWAHVGGFLGGIGITYFVLKHCS